MSAATCPNCGEPGNPGHHWLDQPGVYSGYVCEGRLTDTANEVAENIAEHMGFWEAVEVLAKNTPKR